MDPMKIRGALNVQRTYARTIELTLCELIREHDGCSYAVGSAMLTAGALKRELDRAVEEFDRDRKAEEERRLAKELPTFPAKTPRSESKKRT